MATKKYTYADVMKMKEVEFKALIHSKPEYKAWLTEAVERTEAREIYPRMKVWSEDKQKFVYVADKSKRPVIKSAPISFFTLKSEFCAEMLKIEKKQDTAKPTFRDRLLAD